MLLTGGKDKDRRTKMPDENRVFDVAKPGHSSPEATSKPVIVGHQPTMSDPMVKDEADSEPTKIMVHDQNPLTPTSVETADNGAPAIMDPKDEPADIPNPFSSGGDQPMVTMPEEPKSDWPAPETTADTPSEEPVHTDDHDSA
jgi:hypothetical protein